MPDGVAPKLDGVFGKDAGDEELSLEAFARVLFASRNGCTVADVDNLLALPDLQQQFDQIMDSITDDPLTDDCVLASDKDFIDRLASAGLINPQMVNLARGVGVSTHRPYHRERWLATQAASK